MATSANIFITGVGSIGSNTDATSYAFGSLTPVSGQIVLVCAESLKATTPDTPTASGTNGFSGSWTQIGSTVTLQTAAGNYIGVSWFWTLATSGTAGVVTLNYTNTQLACVALMNTSPFINTTTPTAQSGSNTDTSSSTSLPALTLGSALASNQNWCIYALCQNSGTNLLAASTTGYSPAANLGFTSSASDGLAMKIWIQPSNSFTPGAAYVASVAKIIFGIEVAQDGTGASSGGALPVGFHGVVG